MRVLKILGLLLLALVVTLGVTVTAAYFAGKTTTDEHQTDIDPFYVLPDTLPAGPPGTILRTEVMSDIPWQLNGATAYRMIYLTRGPSGEPRASSGMLFVPTKPSKEPRPVVAYAHGTSGFGDSCAPSRTKTTPVNMPWVQTMMDNGWVLAATDYTGLGTEGEPYFLIGESEAEDVINSVRAARNFAEANAGDRYAVMGHSQGGHSALWTGELSKTIAPDLKLVGVAASAPAGELNLLVNDSWNIPNAWGLGPDVLVSWPAVYPQLTADQVATPLGLQDYEELAYQCVESSLLEGEARNVLGQALFTVNPTTLPQWEAVIKQQTPSPYPADMPLTVIASIEDGVVFASSTAVLRDNWCAAGSNLQMNWMGSLAPGTLGSLQAHGDTILDGWPLLTMWIQQRFQDIPATNNCTAANPTLP